MTFDADGKELAVGDVVDFKSDIEQTGQVVAISADGLRLELFNPGGFGGGYLRYSTTAWHPADSCWKRHLE